jgi:hypothetical protein
MSQAVMRHQNLRKHYWDGALKNSLLKCAQIIGDGNAIIPTAIDRYPSSYVLMSARNS